MSYGPRISSSARPAPANPLCSVPWPRLPPRSRRCSRGLDSNLRRFERPAEKYLSSQSATDRCVTSYDIQLQPVEGLGGKTEATLLDSSGVSAKEMLASKQPFIDSNPLKKPALDADTVVLVVDASMPGKQLAEEFQEFARWLQEFRKTRAAHRRRPIAGLPRPAQVRSTRQADRLVQPVAAPRKSKRETQDQPEVSRSPQEQGTGFELLQLRLWATAIKHSPPLGGSSPKKAQEPYGVAELFRHLCSIGGRYCRAPACVAIPTAPSCHQHDRGGRAAGFDGWVPGRVSARKRLQAGRDGPDSAAEKKNRIACAPPLRGWRRNVATCS